MSEKIIAAVPAYNAGDHLLQLAGQLDAQNFDDVYILDDGSTDGSIERLAQEFPAMQVIAGIENRGPAVNRNRVLEAVEDGLVVFIDADMTLEQGDVPEQVRRALGRAGVGLAGGYILDKEHRPMQWNYGFEMHPTADVWFSQVREMLDRDDLSEELRANLELELKSANMDYHWVDPLSFSLERRKVDWVAEGLFAVRAELFRRLGGYDEEMPYHEGQDLARRVRAAGMDVVFDPAFSAVHQDFQVDSASQRQRNFTEGQFYFFQKHWGMSRAVFDRIYRTTS